MKGRMGKEGIESTLLDREAFFRLISENVTDLIAVIDKNGRRIYNSPSYERVLGSIQNIRGSNSFAEIHPEDRDRIQRIFQETLATGIGQRAEYRFLLPDGTVRFVESQGSVIRDAAGIPAQVVVVSRDITERKRADEALAAERNLLRTVIDNLPDYVYVKDSQSRFVLNNAAHVRVLGAIRFDQVVGKCDTDFFPPEMAAQYLADEQAILETGRSLLNREEPVKDELGRERWVLTTKVPLRDSRGKIVGIVGMTRDITERRLAEGRLNAAYSELARSDEALREAHNRLKQSHEELQATQLQLIEAAKFESVGSLAAGVAHEVKNPLQTILMGVDYLNKHTAGQSATIAMVLGDMREAIKRADGIIRGLLEFSSPTLPQLLDEDLNFVVERALTLVKYELTKSRIELVKELASDLPLVTLDRNKLEQALINLFMNAAQAMGEGGSLTVRTKLIPTSQLSAAAGGTTRFLKLGDLAVITQIEDTGPGIPNDKLSRIFDPFFTTKPTGVGTGLGLTVTKKIIELHGGAIEIINKPDRGVKVTLVLKPATRSAAT
jgi:PAS domain S-box-containing protein